MMKITFNLLVMHRGGDVAASNRGDEACHVFSSLQQVTTSAVTPTSVLSYLIARLTADVAEQT